MPSLLERITIRFGCQHGLRLTNTIEFSKVLQCFSLESGAPTRGLFP